MFKYLTQISTIKCIQFFQNTEDFLVQEYRFNITQNTEYHRRRCTRQLQVFTFSFNSATQDNLVTHRSSIKLFVVRSYKL